MSRSRRRAATSQTRRGCSRRPTRKPSAGCTRTVTTLRDKQLGDGRPVLLLLWAAVGIVLIVACANIVNLLVARNVARTRETSIRQALGASRGQLVVQGLIESGLLAAGGVGGGVVIAQVAATALTRVDPQTVPPLHDENGRASRM